MRNQLCHHSAQIIRLHAHLLDREPVEGTLSSRIPKVERARHIQVIDHAVHPFTSVARDKHATYTRETPVQWIYHRWP